MTHQTSTRKERTLGALLGVHAGDSLGAKFEFMPWDAVHRQYPQGIRDMVGGGFFKWPAGHATDDTDLTRAILLAYKDAEVQRRSGNPKTNIVLLTAQQMVAWYDGNWPDRTYGRRPRDVGGATDTGIRNFKRTGDPYNSGAGEGSAGNGSLMRCIPTALFAADSVSREKESVALSAITHDDKTCTIACAAYNAMVHALVEGKTPLEAWQAGRDVASSIHARSQDSARKNAAKKVEDTLDQGKSLISVNDLAENGPTGAKNGTLVIPYGASGYVLESLAIAVAALLDPRPLEDVLIDVVRIGMDADTNGAIAGGLLGARDGVEGIPARWREKLQFGKEFAEVLDYMLEPE
ncbi:ADP-ribosylation/Crystallin J1 [Podospora didyma]|uniref:ADP-ribosylhydrolase ARH3 n=1 Tax=Podospora didyma TaxID=330526 RepID=A0AAE0NY09_9PEZI|nr:ADP-ribosylation/Crystallin J1 [Podospora didyma]